MTTATLKYLSFDNGERAVLLADESGTPLYCPNLYITTQVRSAGKALGTIKMSLIALQVLEPWHAINNGVSVDENRAIIHVIGIYCGVPQSLECFRVARKVLEI